MRKSITFLSIAAMFSLLFSASVIPSTTSTFPELDRAIQKMQPTVPKSFTDELKRKENAPLEVALVFGRSQGACRNAEPEMIHMVADAAIEAGLKPRLLASLVAVESGCDPLAISREGAVGLTQVRAKVWAAKYDITGKVNLLNPHDNLYAGSHILADYVKQYGEHEGLHRFNGLGVGCASCDSNYNWKVESLASGRT